MTISNKLSAPNKMMSYEDYAGPMMPDGKGPAAFAFLPNFLSPEYPQRSPELVKENQELVNLLDTKAVGPFYLYYGAQPVNTEYKKFYESSIQVILLDPRDQKAFESVFSARGWTLDPEAHQVNLKTLAIRAHGEFVHEGPALDNLMHAVRSSTQADTPDPAKIEALMQQVWSAPQVPTQPSRKLPRIGANP